MSTGPAEAFPVGEHLVEELDERGWTQAEFAEILGRPPQVISEIVSGRKEITRESAAQIAAALGTSPQFWLNLQDQYHLWRQAQDASSRRQLDDVRLRARLNELAPLTVLRKRGVITAATPQGQAEQLCRLLEIDSIDQEPRLPMAARRSNVAERVSPAQVAWLACVRRQAKQRRVPAYSVEALRALAERLSRLVRDPAAFASLRACSPMLAFGWSTLRRSRPARSTAPRSKWTAPQSSACPAAGTDWTKCSSRCCTRSRTSCSTTSRTA